MRRNLIKMWSCVTLLTGLTGFLRKINVLVFDWLIGKHETFSLVNSRCARNKRRWYGVDVGSMWGRCEADVGSMLGSCKVDIESMWGRCKVDAGSMWGRCRVDAVSIWGRCGVDVRSMWGRCGVDVESMWGRYRVDAGGIRPIRMRHL